MASFNGKAVSDGESRRIDKRYYGFQRLFEKMNINDLTHGTGFHVPIDDDHEDGDSDKYTPYEGPEVFPHLNISCLGPEVEDSNTDPLNESDTPFSCIAKSMFNLLPDGKVKKRILSDGYGIVVPDGAVVLFHYNSYYEGNDQPFDSSYLRGSMTRLRLQSGKCIVGLDIGLSSMKCGEKAEFLIHPQYAYGVLGVPPRIPENQHILICVNLKKYADPSLNSGTTELAEDEDSKSFQEIYKEALNSLFRGNAEFAEQNYVATARMYRHGILLLENCNMNNDQEDAENERLRLKLYTNLGVCYNKLNRPKQAIVQCRNALNILPRGPKILYNLSLAHLNLSSFDEAHKFAFIAKKYAPNNEEIDMLFLKIQKKMEKYNSSAVTFARNAFGFEGNNTREQSNNGYCYEESNTSNETQESSDKSDAKDKSSEVKLLSSNRTSDADLKAKFERKVISYVEDFVEDRTEGELPLPVGLSYEEEMFFRRQATMHGLKFEDRDGKLFFLK